MYCIFYKKGKKKILTCKLAENNISSPNCFLILSHLSKNLGNLEYLVPLKS